jgi:hypothetical protein
MVKLPGFYLKSRTEAISTGKAKGDRDAAPGGLPESAVPETNDDQG